MAPQAVTEFQQLLTGLADEAGKDISGLLGRLGRLDAGEARAFLTDAYPELITPYLASAGDLTAVWYEAQPGDAGFQAVAAELAPVEQLGTSARWALTQSDPVKALQGSGTRAVFRSQRNTVVANAERERIKWARHASARACGFCRMLATRGAIYRSQASAKRSHDHCHCIAVPNRDGSFAPPAYVHEWTQDYDAARAAGHHDVASIAQFMDTAGRARDTRIAVGRWLDAEDEHRAAVAYYESPEAQLPKLLGDEPPAPPPAPKAKGAKRTLDDVEAEFAAAAAAGDDAAMDKLAAEMERVEARERKAAEAAAAKQAAYEAQQDRILELVEQGYDPVEAEAEATGATVESIRRRDFINDARAAGHTGKGFDELLAWRFEELAAEQYWAAEAATNGYMVKSPYKLKFDARNLWTVNETTARKYMSEEMAAWFDEHGRITKAGLRDAILSGRGNWRNPMTEDFNQ